MAPVIGDPAAEGQLFRSLADQSLEFIGVCDLAFKPVYVNQAGLRLLGLGSLEEACAIKVQDYFFPEDRQYVHDEFFPRVMRESRPRLLGAHLVRPSVRFYFGQDLDKRTRSE